MPTQKLQPSRALQVIPSDNANIPYPNLITSGVISGLILDELNDNDADFILDNIQVGDIVYSPNMGLAATVIEVINFTTLLLNASIFSTIGQSYIIYNASSQTSNGNQGAVLYIGGAGSIKVTTSGNDIITFAGIQAGTFFPVNVVKVWAAGTDCTEIIALW